MFILPSERITIPARTAGIYALVQASTGRVYVGRSVNIPSRLREHLRMSRSSKPLSRESCSYLYRAWRSDPAGWYAYILEVGATEESIAEREAHWINFFDATSGGCGFNLAAPTPHVPVSDDLRRRISEAQRGRKRGPLSDETKAKISAAQIGKTCKPLSEAHKKRISETFSGKHLSAEHRAKLSAAALGRPKTAEHRANLAEAARRQPPASDETRAKMAAAKRGLVRSEEHCRNISKAKRGVPNPKLVGRPVSAETRAKTAATIKATLAAKKLAKQQEMLQDTTA